MAFNVIFGENCKAAVGIAILAYEKNISYDYFNVFGCVTQISLRYLSGPD